MLLAVAATIAAVPGFTLIVMLLSGSAAAPAVFLGLLADGIASFTLAALFLRDVEILSDLLRDGGVPQRLDPQTGLNLPPLAALGRSIERFCRVQAAGEAATVRRLRANEAILDRLPDPMLVLGADRSVRRANAAARALFGADMGAVLRHPGLRGAIDRAIDQRSPQVADLNFAVPVAREVQASINWIDPPLDDGGVVFALLSDRTRERAVERMRADFVANASHELRTPLASVIGFIETLRGPAADDVPAQSRFLAIMAEQALRMNRLIDDLLSLSRIELTEHQPPSERVHLDGVVRNIAESFEPRLGERDTTLEVAVQPGLPVVTADRDQLVQVLQNLVDNAVKYGRSGGTVRLAAENAPAGGRWPVRPGVVLSVSDDGPGIPRAHIPRLTERFYRVDKGRSRNAGGTGLGLAIVKHIVNRHRGQLVIESEVGAGTTFTVWLPIGADK